MRLIYLSVIWISIIVPTATSAQNATAAGARPTEAQRLQAARNLSGAARIQSFVNGARRALEDESPRVRAAAAHAVATRWSARQQIDSTFAGLRDQDESLHRAAVLDAMSLLPRLSRVARTGDPDAVASAVHAIGEIGRCLGTTCLISVARVSLAPLRPTGT